MYVFKPFTLVEQKVRNTKKPKARSGHRIVCDKRNLYSFGGFNPNLYDDIDLKNDEIWLDSQPLFKEIWQYNFATKYWKRLSGQKTMPNVLASNAAVLRDDVLVVYGGTGVPFGINCSNDVYSCNVDDGRMNVIPSTGEKPIPQYGQAMICHGSYLYVVGGTTGQDYTCDVHRFDLETRAWDSLYICTGKDPNEPKGRYKHELAFDGRLIYVFGGGTAYESYDFAELPAFDVLINKWTTVSTRGDSGKNFPASRRCHGLVQYVNEKTGSIVVVITGGMDGTQCYNDVWSIDLDSLQWTCLKLCLPQQTYFHSTAITPAGQMFTFGGIVRDNNKIKRIDKLHSVWLVIPKLSEICREAVNYYQSTSTALFID